MQKVDRHSAADDRALHGFGASLRLVRNDRKREIDREPGTMLISPGPRTKKCPTARGRAVGQEFRLGDAGSAQGVGADECQGENTRNIRPRCFEFCSANISADRELFAND